MESLLDFLSPEIMDILNGETSDSEQTLVTGQPAIQRNILFTTITWSCSQEKRG